jgi:hypothetical protein
MDPANPVISLCAQGMALEGNADAARRLFERAWAARRDDFEAAVAAHFVARHQSTPAATLHWNALAVQHAEAVTDDRTAGLLASLYLNLGDAHARLGHQISARAAVQRAADHLAALPPGGYREFVAMGIERLTRRLETAEDSEHAI